MIENRLITNLFKTTLRLVTGSLALGVSKGEQCARLWWSSTNLLHADETSTPKMPYGKPRDILLKPFIQWFLLTILFWLLFSDALYAAEVRAWLDRSTMQLGETVTLNVELANSSSSEAPNFSALETDFKLLGTSSSQQISTINGSRSNKLLWAIGLEPKHTGLVTIPPLQVAGILTNPLTLTVLEAPSGASGKQGDDVFLEFKIEPHTVYVQQQLQFSVKLYFAVNLTEGNLEDPHADGLVVHKLGQDQNYQSAVAGRRYQVLERHYAAIPEKSGAFQLGPIAFRGRALDPNDRNSFFNRGRSVIAQSDTITLEVRPRPGDSGSGPWLPAAALSVASEGVNSSTSLHVGEVLTVTVRLKAQGLGFEQLPELNLPKPDTAELYPDKPVNNTRDDGIWLYGERERKFAIVPSQPGKLSLPGMRIEWWDTQHDRAAIAEFPTQEITVLPAVESLASSLSTGAVATPTLTTTPAAPVTQTPMMEGVESYWRWLALASCALWVLTVAGLLIGRYINRRTEIMPCANAPIVPVTSAKARAAFRAACASSDLTAVAHSLLDWARSEQPDVRNLGEVAARLNDAAQRTALQTLEQARYGEGTVAGLEQRLLNLFASGFSFDHAKAQATDSALPPLYPFKI